MAEWKQTNREAFPVKFGLLRIVPVDENGAGQRVCKHTCSRYIDAFSCSSFRSFMLTFKSDLLSLRSSVASSLPILELSSRYYVAVE